MKQPTYSKNARVEFKDADGIFHVGYVKSRVRKGVFRKRWIYDVCAVGRPQDKKKVYTVPEGNIFGVIERKEKTGEPTNEQLNELQNKFNRQ